MNVPILDRLALSRQSFGQPIFMEIVIVAAWCIWSMHNGIIFYGKSLSLWRWKSLLHEELSLIVLRCKSSKKPLLQDWLLAF